MTIDNALCNAFVCVVGETLYQTRQPEISNRLCTE